MITRQLHVLGWNMHARALRLHLLRLSSFACTTQLHSWLSNSSSSFCIASFVCFLLDCVVLIVYCERSFAGIMQIVSDRSEQPLPRKFAQ